MNNKLIIIIIGLILFVCNSLLSNTIKITEENIEIGKKYLSNNCKVDLRVNTENHTFNISDDQEYQSWHSFKTPKERQSVELNFASLNLGEQSSLSIYNADKTDIIWTTKGKTLPANISKKFVSLDVESSYHIVVSSIEENQGEYTLQLDLSMPPPINDVCEGAIDIGSLNCGFASGYFSDPEATPDIEATGNCINNTEPAQWYTFTTSNMLSFNTVFLQFLNSNNTAFEVFSTTSGCDGLVYQDCGEIFLTFEVQSETQYYILVNEGFGLLVGNYQIPTTCQGPNEIFGDPSANGGLTSCGLPSSLVPCENDHVRWYNYTKGCVESDIIIGVEETSTVSGFSANEISISVFLSDCTLAAQYDVNGLGYVCAAMSAGETINLANVPIGTELKIAFGSGFNNTGFFDFSITEPNEGGEVLNDICVDGETVVEGLNTGLSTVCADFTDYPDDAGIQVPECVPHSEATVWFEYDPGDEPKDITVNIITSEIAMPGIAAFEKCVENVLAVNCGTTIEVSCVNEPLMIVVASSHENEGDFDLEIIATPSNSTEIFNDICPDAELLNEGVNANLTNECSSFSGAPNDTTVPLCSAHSEATVWYEYDPGGIPQDIVVNLNSTGISSPAMAIYDGCIGEALDSDCGTSLQVFCVDSPILIQVVSKYGNTGSFDLEIESSNSPEALIPIISGDDICSDEEAEIFIDIPGGELVNIYVEVAPTSSTSIIGMTTFTFEGVNSATLDNILTNENLAVEEAIYRIVIEPLADICPTPPIDYSINVYPKFIVNETSIEECFPSLIEIEVNELIQGGTSPYSSVSWIWNGNLISSDNTLLFSPEDSGTIVLEVSDGQGCMERREVEITISQPETPTFDFPLYYCRSDQNIINFPTISQDGIEGTWNVVLINLEVFTGNGYIDITFTPDPSFCSLSEIVTIFIDPGEELEFYLPESFCSEEGLYVFPTQDLNGITGNWEADFLDLSTLSGSQINTFYPNAQGCYATYEYEFEVQDKIDLIFELPDTICRNEGPVELNNVSQGGYEGTWDIPILDPSIVIGDVFTSTWTPNDGQSQCIKDTVITIQLIDPKSPDFILPNELCASGMIFTFPTIDNQNISGTWSISSIDPGEETGGIQSVFTPEDDCTNIYTWEIEIVEPLVPEFNFDLELCSLDDVFTLPLVSDNGIPGTWTQSTIDPSMNAGTQIMVEFVGDPTEFCVEPIELLFDITEAEDPSFILTNQLCWTDADLILPLVSTNGIEGIWTPDIIEVQSNLGGIINSTFSPTDGSCSNEEVQSFEILSPFVVDPIVTDPTDCAIEDGSIIMDVIQGVNLEFSIDDGISWQSTTSFTSLGSGGFTILVRFTDLDYCTLSVEAFLSSPDGPVINEVFSDDISSCIAANGSITLDATGNNLEYSIDNGATWQASNEFNNLPVGDYVINIREVMSDCVVDVSAEVMDFPQTEILGVNTQDLSDCNTNDGQIVILAEGESLEYSIDNGVTWSTQNTFNNLPNGQYPIMVQSTVGEDCIATMDVELIAPDVPSIVNISIGNSTICAPNTGRIEIDAAGLNLEYSIDGGVTWQSSNIFTDLPSDDYQVMVRDSERINCIDEGSASIILEDESLAESTFILTPPSICDKDDARIEVTNTTAEVEYSIDGGMTWQSTNIFDDLLAGDYMLITRKIALPDCLIEQLIELPNTDCPCRDLTLDFDVSNIDCSGEDSGVVELVSIVGMYDSDIDIEWQNGETGLIIEGIGEGWQIVTIKYDEKCDWTDSVWVDIVKPIEFELNVQDLDCPGINNGFIEIFDVTGGRGFYEYSLDGSNYQSESEFTGLEEGTFTVYVRDDLDCITKNEIEIYSLEKIDIDLPEVESIIRGGSIILDPGINPLEIDSFAWTPIDGILNLNDLVIEISPKETITYSLDIFYGLCAESREILIEVSETVAEDIRIGNVFSPNGDNHNDALYIQGISNSTIVMNTFSVYDRWGNEVFNVSQPEFNNQEQGWDGQSNGQLAMQGVYVYVIEYVQDGQPQTKIGTVTLVY